MADADRVCQNRLDYLVNVFGLSKKEAQRVLQV